MKVNSSLTVRLESFRNIRTNNLPDQSRRQLIQSGIYRLVVNHEEEAPKGSECFAYESFERFRSVGRSIEQTIINIELLSELEEDYKKNIN